MVDCEGRAGGEGEGIIVCVEAKTGNPVPVPEDVRAAIERAESPAAR